MFFTYTPFMFRDFLLPSKAWTFEDDDEDSVHNVIREAAPLHSQSKVRTAEKAKSSDRSTQKKKAEDDNLTFSMDLPGVKAEDLKISVERGFLTISAIRKILPSNMEGGSAAKKVRISRSVALDDNVDPSSIKANLSDGVLVITAHRRKSPDPIVIPITTEHHKLPIQEQKEEKQQVASAGSARKIAINGKSSVAEDKPKNSSSTASEKKDA